MLHSIDKLRSVFDKLNVYSVENLREFEFYCYVATIPNLESVLFDTPLCLSVSDVTLEQYKSILKNRMLSSNDFVISRHRYQLGFDKLKQFKEALHDNDKTVLAKSITYLQQFN